MISRATKFNIKAVTWRRLLALVLGLTFFAFVDGKYRGWDDTNQYQIEAKLWSQGKRPPSPELLRNDQGLGVEYRHYAPVMVSYVWGKLLVDLDDWHRTLIRIRALQAGMLAASFFMVFEILGATWGALGFAILFFFNGFFRDLLSVPITDIQSIFLLVATYYFSKGTGALAALQALTRPPVTVLHLQRLWEKRKSMPEMMSALAVAGVFVWIFGPLAKGGPMIHAGWGAIPALLNQFQQGLAEQFFAHLLPFRTPVFQWAWSAFLIFMAVVAARRLIRAPALLAGATAYLIAVLGVFSQGVRYFVPLILAVLLELKPRFPKRRVLLVPLVLIICHLGFQQFESARGFLRGDTPETETGGLIAAREWIHANPDSVKSVMMKKFRYCINFFGVQCYNYPDTLNATQLDRQIQEKRIDFLITSGTAWQHEEREIEHVLEDLFTSRRLEFSKAVRTFDKVRVVDLRGLREG